MKTLPQVLLTLSLTAATVLSAQPVSSESGHGPRRGGPGGPGGPGGHGRGPGGPPIVRVLDADRDYEISAAEIAGSAAALRTLDANGDGIVSAEELHPARPGNGDRPGRPDLAPGGPRGGGRKGPGPGAGNGPGRPIFPVMLALDADGDGALSATEIANAPASLAALDANKDGKLTFDELRPLPPQE